ncbi:MAG: hypothetical protein ACE5Q6_14200 [Dehalococcoidia bacterium]
MSSPLVGAWEFVSDTHQGVWVFTETHYSAVMMRKDRQRIEGRELTPSEVLEAYQSVNALSGSYTVSGSRMKLERTANLRADLIGVDMEAEFTIEGDRMTVRSISGTSVPRDDVWRKVS